MADYLLTDEALITGFRVFNELVEKGDVLYSPLAITDFAHLFTESTEETERFLIHDEQARGFSSGCIEHTTGKAYITYIGVRPEYRNQGVGTELLRRLELILRHHLQNKHLIEISFLNPCTLNWIVPGTPGHDHPNAPGVLTNSDAEQFFHSRGYETYAIQDSYYLNLEGYQVPDALLNKQRELRHEGISFETYDASRHVGILELLVDLGSEQWKQEILTETKKPDGGRPILVPVRAGRVYGFTGPLDVQTSGRGYFAGIGVHRAKRGKGIAKVLFAHLCDDLKNMGAQYMTLFTGKSNPARYIYEAAGFKVVSSWADMRKECIE